jgi:hypothetical protein
MEEIIDKIFKYYCDLHNIGYTKQYEPIGTKITYRLKPNSFHNFKRNDILKILVLFDVRYLIVHGGNILYIDVYIADF